jgi:hypothetical protein
MAALQAMAEAVGVFNSKKKEKGEDAAIWAIPMVEYSTEIALVVCSSTECAICLA